MSYTKMPFGKFKGTHLEELPSTYIVYALESFELPEELCEGLLTQLKRRFTIPVEILNFDSVKSIYKDVAKEYHPDKGGSDIAMQAINEFYNRIKQIKQ